MTILPGLSRLIKKKKDKKNKLFHIFKEYIEVVSSLKSLKESEKALRIKQLENQIDEYYISLKDIIDLSELQEYSDELLEKVKHISEIAIDNFKFVELYVVSTDKGILLSTEPSSNSDLIRLATYKKVYK